MDLAEVELALSEHADVAAAAAKLWQLPAAGVLAAYVELTGGARAGTGTDGLQAWCRQRLPPAAVPRHVVVLPRLPRSAAGKVQRWELPAPPAVVPEPGPGGQEGEAGVPDVPASKRLRRASSNGSSEGAGAAAAAAAHHAHVSELAVSRAFAAALGHAGFEATSNLFALGGDSLTAALVAGQVAGGDVDAVLRHPTVRSLAAHLNSRAAAAAAMEGGPAEAAGGAVTSKRGADGREQLSARQLDVSSSALPQPNRLGLAWRARMLQCVDAAPVLDVASAAEPATAAQQPRRQQQQQQGSRVFACSHGGDVCCFDSSTGQAVWRSQLHDQTDAGLVVCRRPTAGTAQRFVAVAGNGGTLFFLDADTGSIAGTVDAGGGLRAAPVCDPWHGLVWQPTHGRQLVVLAAPGHEVARVPLPASASASVTFARQERLALVCSLDGSLLAIAVDAAATSVARGDAPAPTGDLLLRVEWQHRASAPLFVPATVVPSGNCVVVAAVDGSVVALRLGCGAELWRARVDAAVFAPPLLLPEAPGHQHVLLLGTQTGQLMALDVSSGQQLAAVSLGAKVTGMSLPEQRRLLVCLAPGVVALLDLEAMLAPGGGGHAQHEPGDGTPTCVCDTVRLPADAFATPATAPAAGSVAAVGCRG